MNKEVIFRNATIDDVEVIIDLCNEVFEENTDYEYARSVFEKTQMDPNQIYIVGELGNEIVSHAKITIIPTMYKNMGTYAILNHVCVKPQYRRQNIATLMLKVVDQICAQNNAHIVELWSNNYRTAAHSCYKKYGFIPHDATFFSKEIELGVKEDEN